MAKTIKTEYLIIGAGPTGIGAAYRLKELNKTDFIVIDKDANVGGLSQSFVDDKGFTWDIGGHVQFSHYKYFDKAMEEALPNNGWLNHQREAWVWMKKRFIPYPFQNNIHSLPKEDIEKCLEGLSNRENDQRELNNFEDWIYKSFGEGIADLFLMPYNKKVWATHPSLMNYKWIGERVAHVDLQKIKQNVLLKKDDVSWGPNSTFQFPKTGGTGSIWTSLAKLIGEKHFKLNSELNQIDTDNKIAFIDGLQIQYEHILSTIPIPELTKRIIPFDDKMNKKAEELPFSSSNIVGIGLKGEIPNHLETKCWMYFPEKDCPFYRVTAFSNYSPNNVPDKNYWSVMAEVSESDSKTVNWDDLINDVIQGLINTRIVPNSEDIVSKWRYKAHYGYPTPGIKRDQLLEELIPALEKKGVFSRGRFGAWKYEVSNQDHSFMQGVEWINRIETKEQETTYFFPEIANKKKS